MVRLITVEDVNYWLDLVEKEIGMRDIDATKRFLQKLIDANIMYCLFIEDTGIFAYIISEDFDGTTSLVESLFYIHPKHRGSIKLVKKYINKIEEIAKENNCNTIKIGANMKYKDSSFLKLLQRWGYAVEVCSKDVNATI